MKICGLYNKDNHTQSKHYFKKWDIKQFSL